MDAEPQAERDSASAELGFAVRRMSAYVNQHADPALDRLYSDLMVAFARWIEQHRMSVVDSTERLAR